VKRMRDNHDGGVWWKIVGQVRRYLGGKMVGETQQIEDSF
jgi:hypothetical protein